MINGIYYAHSGWRYIIILVFAIALLKFLIGVATKAQWSKLDRQLALFTFVSMDIQLILGLVLWVMQQRWTGGLPLSSWEHPFTMIVGVVLAHMTWTRIKRAPDAAKFQTALVGYLVAAVVVGLGIARITYVI